MTGLGPSLRRLPSGDPKPTPGGSAGVADGKPEGGSDAGDSLDGQLSGGWHKVNHSLFGDKLLCCCNAPLHESGKHGALCPCWFDLPKAAALNCLCLLLQTA